jgi:hypothetical protein
MAQESEVITLILGLTGLLILLQPSRSFAPPLNRLFKAGFFTMVGAFFFTVVEGFLFYGLFNFLEHLCYAVSGWLFAGACWRLYRDMASNKQPGEG